MLQRWQLFSIDIIQIQLSLLQFATHQWIQSISYVFTGRIFDMFLRLLNEVFMENSLQRFVALIFTLLLVPLEAKLVNFSTHRQCTCLNTSRLSMYRCFISLLKRMGHMSHFHNFHEGLIEALIIGQFLSKRYQKKRYLMGYKSLKDVCQKHLV